MPKEKSDTTDFIPYGRQSISNSDIDAVLSSLKSDMITQGPAISIFEDNFIKNVEADFGCAVCNASAGLHLAYKAVGVQRGDVVWTSPNTFVATANAALYEGATVDFVDTDPDTFCMSVSALKAKLEKAKKNGGLPKLVVPVHLAGQPCEMEEIYNLSKQYGFKIVEDASHAVGARYQNKPIGSCQYSDACVFSFHPVKIITTGEGGMVTTRDKNIAEYIKMGRTHGITKERALMNTDAPEPWFYEQHFLGYNFRMTDIQAALGNSQLKNLEANIQRREQIASRYQDAFSDLPLGLQNPLQNASSSWHLFIVMFDNSSLRRKAFDKLQENNIGTQVHYIPVHMQPYYVQQGFKEGDFPEAEDYYSRCLSLPMFHGLTDQEQDRVIQTIKKVF